MKLTKPLSTLGLLAVAATSVICGPAAANAAPPSAPTTEAAPTAADRLTGPFVMQWSDLATRYGPVQLSADGIIEMDRDRWGGDVTREQAVANAVIAEYPMVGTTGPIKVGDQCLGSGPVGTGVEGLRAYACSSPSVQQFTLRPNGEITVGSQVVRAALMGGTSETTVILQARDVGLTPIQGLDLSLQVPDETPTASIETPTLYPGQSVEVTTTFSAGAAGRRVDIDHPAGTKVTAVADAAFSLTDGGASGILPAGTRSLRFTLTADANAPIGSATGGGVFWFESRIKLADFSADIVAPPVVPSVTVPSVTVNQGASVEVPVSFNETALGATEIVVPAGFASGSATGGFVWDASVPGFRGTVTTANRDFTLTLTAKADAPVGAAEGRVTQAGSGLNQAWSVTVESAAPAPVAPLVVESPKVGDTIREATPVFRGTAQPGSRIVIRGLWGGVLGSVDEVDKTGAWSITWNKSLLPARYVGGTVEQFVAGAPTQMFVYDFTVGTSNIAPLLVTSPTIGGTVTEASPVFTGTAQPGSRIVIRGASGTVLGEIDEVDASGAWSITWNKSLLPNRYVGGTVKQFVDGVATHTYVYDFTIIRPRLVVTSPKVGDAISGTRPVFTGTANPGARVQITGAWGTDLGSVYADERTGAWTITWPRDYLPARYSGGTVTEAIDGKIISSSGYDFTLVP